MNPQYAQNTTDGGGYRAAVIILLIIITALLAVQTITAQYDRNQLRKAIRSSDLAELDAKDAIIEGYKARRGY